MLRGKTTSLPVLLSSDFPFFVALHRWFQDVSSRPVWLAIKDVDVTSNYTCKETSLATVS
jgi:hypothetical protein